jgi:hypothetical protein
MDKKRLTTPSTLSVDAGYERDYRVKQVMQMGWDRLPGHHEIAWHDRERN